MTHAYRNVGTPRRTPQSEAIPGSEQVPNSAGGYAWQIDKWSLLDRFLILGSEGGTYYIKEPDLTKANALNLLACIAEDGPRTVRRIVEISHSGRAPRNTPAIFALAVAAAADDVNTRRVALDAIPAVCRTGTHLFQFAMLVEGWRGWGRSLRRGIGQWYEQDIDKLAYQVVKYRQREGWTHRDLLRLAHVAAPSPEHAALYDWVAHRDTNPTYVAPVPTSIEAFEKAMHSGSPAETAALVRQYGGALPREAILPEHMTSAVWRALFDVGMPITALIRNLANLTRHGILKPLSTKTAKATTQITDDEVLRKGRVHPYAILLAMATYGTGGRYGQSRGDTYEPVSAILEALDAAFYKTFPNVPTTNARIMLGLDVSASMTTPILGRWDERRRCMADVPLSVRDGAAAMAMVTRTREPNCMTVAFTSQGGWNPKNNVNGYRPPSRWQHYPLMISEVDLRASRSVADVVRTVSQLPAGGTDCALPMLYAADRGIEVDAFVIYTDNETWAGSIHPSQALVRYREKTGINAKLVVVGMASNGFTIANPNDAGQLDVVGFDTNAPAVIGDTISG